MIFASIGLFLVAGIIFIKDYKTESTKWMAALCFFSGLGTLSVVFNTTIISTILSNISHYIAPYVALMYGLSYANIVKKNKKIIYIILFIPSIICFMSFPLVNNSLKTTNELKLYFKLLSIWAVPYILGGAFL